MATEKTTTRADAGALLNFAPLIEAIQLEVMITRLAERHAREAAGEAPPALGALGEAIRLEATLELSREWWRKHGLAAADAEIDREVFAAWLEGDGPCIHCGAEDWGWSSATDCDHCAPHDDESDVAA